MIKTEYTIHTACIPRNVKLALIADLHEREPSEALAILTKEQPAFIAIAGDLFENHEHGENLDKADDNAFSRFVCRVIHGFDYFVADHPNLFKKKRSESSKENACRLLREASQIAPVIMSVGNHELYFTDEDMKLIQETGVTLLDNDSKEIDGILFGGLTSKCAVGKLDTGFLEKFSAGSEYKILLCHHPEYYQDLTSYNIDLVLSGHAHGGQFRLFGHGIFSPGQGLFPQYTKGVYDGKLVVSAGCSNTATIPRINNPTEVVIVNVEKA